MMGRVKWEMKIAGPNFFGVSAGVTAALLLLAAAAGELLEFYSMSFEVIFPFFAAIAVGEWGKTRADSNFDIIASQGKSLFQWVWLRCTVVFGIVSAFALLCMAGALVFRYEHPFWELLAVYFPPAFLLSSLCALLGIRCRREHMPALICGVIWMVILMTSSLLRIPGVEYIYLFIRYAGDPNGVWLWNKGIITLTGLVLWGGIYWNCRSFFLGRPRLTKL